jgi:FAD/FMN-containing dehydrogenase
MVALNWLSCDNLVSARVVTADGRLINASAKENSDLLWGLRGGGGNFGIVTRFEFHLHPVGPEVMFCFVFHPGADMEAGFRFYRDFTSSSPDEVSSRIFRHHSTRIRLSQKMKAPILSAPITPDRR